MQRETHSFVRASDVIGRDDDKENIVGLLRQSSDTENEKQATNRQISDWLGKLKLVLYDAEDVLDEFDYEALRQQVVASGSSITSKVRSFISSSKSLAFRLKMGHRVKSIRERLDKIAADKSKFNLTEGIANTRVVQRERQRETHSFVRASDVIGRDDDKENIVGLLRQSKLRGLSLEDCLSLFVKCAFKDGEDEQHPNLLKIGEQIIEKCAGVPLAVRSLGSLLHLKRDERDWVSIKESEIWKLEQDENRIMAALKLSYYDLPHHFRQCFALCSIFPKDFEFDNRLLISIWMAQGLIQSSGQNAKMEDIGENYINELLSRSLFQDVKQNVPGVIYAFKMHDLVHDLAIFFAQPEYVTLNFHSKDISKRVQHVAFSDNDWPKEEFEALRFLEKLNNVRTIDFQMDNVAPRSNSFVMACVLRFKCMRVLDLTESSFEVLPDSIDSLKHLRFLNLSKNERIKKLPNSICKLYHLQTLMLGECSELEEFPRGIGSMITLLHFEY
ncbi:unnamed protein product, partial [Vitis vinifera]|uniref:Disease resistance protein RGA3 n=1 Tax=Vitis vinifera TaxID=29760 RepID=D7SJ50_VITVI